jgi:hypothetical protein
MRVIFQVICSTETKETDWQTPTVRPWPNWQSVASTSSSWAYTRTPPSTWQLHTTASRRENVAPMKWATKFRVLKCDVSSDFPMRTHRHQDQRRQQRLHRPTTTTCLDWRRRHIRVTVLQSLPENLTSYRRIPSRKPSQVFSGSFTMLSVVR